jgi:predicted nucleic acid-binding protein
VDTSDDATYVSDALLLSSIVTFELSYGVGKSERNARNAPRLETFLAGPLAWIAFDDQDGREAGVI